MDEMSIMLSNSDPRRIHAIALFALLILPMSSPGWSDSDLPEASESPAPARIELVDQSVVYGEITDIRDGELYVTTGCNQPAKSTENRCIASASR